MSSPQPWAVIVTPHAERQLRKIARREMLRIRTAIEALASGPDTRDVQKVQGREGVWRLRVGQWLVFFEYVLGQRAIRILSVLHRREAYR